MLPLISIAAFSASAVTVVTDTDRIVSDALERAVELRCPDQQASLMATVTDSDDDGFALVLFDLESNWMDDWSLAGHDYEGEDQARALSMVICGRITGRPPPEPPPVVRAPRQLSRTDRVNLRPYVAMTLLADRPTLGAHVDRCWGKICPEVGLAARARPYESLGRSDMLPDPTIMADLGAGYAIISNTLVGASISIEDSFTWQNTTVYSGGGWVESWRDRPLTWRATARWTRAEWNEQTDSGDWVTMGGVRPAVEVSAVYRGWRR